MTINVPEQASKDLEGSMNQSDSIQLPFPVAYFYVRNGNKRNKQHGGIDYFGGFSVNLKELADLVGDVPDVFKPMAREGNDGTYETYDIRNLLIAPITKRFRWHDNRSNQQIVAMMAVINDGKLVVLGESVLSAKGMQTKYLNEALKDWESRTAEARKAHANDADAKFFWATLGTFEDNPEFLSVGKGSNTSEITPIRLHPQQGEITQEYLKQRYVGDEMANDMAELYPQCQEWISDWKKKDGKEESEDPLPPDNFEEEEFPF